VALAPRNPERTAGTVSVDLLGANDAAHADTLDRLPGITNYFLGKSPAGWISGIPQYARVAFRSVYPGIDLVYYGTRGELESDFVVNPGADPKKIALHLAGMTSLNLSSSGNLVMQVPQGLFELKQPTIYQNIHGTHRLIAGKFVIRNHDEVGLDVGDYDATQSLVIDPALSYSTLIGANNSTTAQAIGVDSLGNVYITGTTYATNYPTVSAYQPTNHGTTKCLRHEAEPDWKHDFVFHLSGRQRIPRGECYCCRWRRECLRHWGGRHVRFSYHSRRFHDYLPRRLL
jgi:beta-propeller repeat-containing protein